ncbi:Protein of unknown function [Lactobacillus helveticus CIRM-BIA 953]|uniref:Uncharacterized protein n=1 Tax=Lactobacillus helveticus CIRM-BIA 953 TaxID=1226335 RepID=U4QM28_LACHE|nr:Protein of unknown function [Lactobacillus helveticus CIRM-BIA 953]
MIFYTMEQSYIPAIGL